MQECGVSAKPVREILEEHRDRLFQMLLKCQGTRTEVQP